MKIGIGIPSNRGFRPRTVQSLVEMIAHSKLDYSFFFPTEGYNTAENRNQSVAQAINARCSHILISDDDMVYPPDALEKLLACGKDIIGALYSVRRLPRAFVIGYSEDGIKTDEEAERQTEPFRCEAIGTGLMLVKTAIFNKLISPFFGYEWNYNGSVKMSTDWFFCKKAREAGIEIWCEPSLKIGHLGEYEF